MRAVAVVGIKTNNVRMPGKNTRPLGGVPLYAHVWRMLLETVRIDRVLVDSSDQAILASAVEHGFDTHARDPALNGPETSGHDLIRNLLPVIQEEIICQIFVTTPFIRAESVDGAIQALVDHWDTADSVVPVYPVYDRFWHNGNPVAHDPRSLVGTQFMAPLMRESGFYVFKTSAFAEEDCRVTARRLFIELSEQECVDIDTEIDFLRAESMLRRQQSAPS